MLETRTPPNPNRTRRMDALPHRSAADARLAARATARPVAIGNTALEAAPGLPPSRPAARPRTSRLGRSEMRLMGLATTCTAVVCGLLLLYLAAYAHVSQLGYDQAEARVQLRHYQLQNESLRAKRDFLQSRTHVIRAAIALGMTPRGSTPITYIAAPRRAQDAPRQDAARQDAASQGGFKTMTGTAPGGEQTSHGDTTAGGDEQPSFGH